MIKRECETINISIYIAGDYALAKQVCREWCMKGACVTVEYIQYIYYGGEEAGVKVSFINYPRFESNEDDLLSDALDLANTLLDRLCQKSYSVTAPSKTIYVSRIPQ